MLAVAEHPAAYSESALAVLWGRAHTLVDALVTESGRRLRVIYPGRPSSGAGPDFRDAVLVDSDGASVTGDIELHTTAPGWYSHGHDTDSNYNGVVLHVVFSPKGHTDTAQQSLMKTPIVSLEPVAKNLETANPSQTPSLVTLETLRGSRDIGSVLDAAGDARFLAKSQGDSLEMSESGPDETLYRGIMEALGYATNRKPFRALASKVPYESLSRLRDEPPSTRLVAVRASLLGASGLLDLADEIEDREQMRRLLKRLPRVKPLDKSDWRLFRVRPSNHPVRRIIGAAYMLDACIEQGLLPASIEDLTLGGQKALTARYSHPPYIGRSRALDIVVNVSLPLLHAFAGHIDDQALADTALDAYATVPKMQDNEITREMRRLCNIDSDVKLTARRQQGLIHLYKTAVGKSHT